MYFAEAIKPINIAVAMAAATPADAMRALALDVERRYFITASNLVWSATSLPVRHGLIMEWLAKEVAA